MILDASGSPITSQKFLAAASPSRARPYDFGKPEGIRKTVSEWDWKTIVHASRKLFANMGMPKGAICQKAMHSVGNAWLPKFEGEAKEWGDIATQWLIDEWFVVHDVRGPMFDFRTDLFLDSISIDRCGDMGVLLTRAEDGKYPLTQRIPSHRIASKASEKFVASGDYAGLKIENGVIYNRHGRPVAYRITDEDDPDKFQDYSARYFIHNFDPEWYDQGRGWPAFTHAINDLKDMSTSQIYEQCAQLIMSRIGLIEYNEKGGPDSGDVATELNKQINLGGAAVSGVTTERLDGGTTLYFKSNSGGKVEAFKPDRPGDVWEKFWDRLTRSALMGINWSFSLAWKGDGLTGTVERTEIKKCEISVSDRQSLLEPSAKRQVGYAISCAIQEKILPPYPGTDKGGFLKWGFTKPPLMSIDNGRDGQSRREDYKLGHRNLTDVLAENGRTLIPHLRERAYEIAMRKKIAREVSEETGEPIDDREMQMLNPNEPAEPKDDEEELPPPAKKESDED